MAATPKPEARLAALGTTAAVIAVISWGVGPVVVKDADVSGLVTTFYRLNMGAALSVAIVYLSGRRMSWALIKGAIPGGVAFGLDILLFFSAVKLTTVADASIIGALQPALVLLVAGRFFGERVGRLDVVLTGVAIAGVGLVVFASGDVPGRRLSGDVLAAAALFAWTWYFVAVKRARQHFGAVEYQAALALVSAVVVSPIVVVSGESLRVPDARNWMLLSLTIVFGAAGHFLMNWAHAYTPIVLTSLLTLASPPVAVVAAAIVVHEPILAGHVVGMIVVSASLGVVMWRTTQTASDETIDVLDEQPR